MTLGLAALLVWLYLALLRDGFWRIDLQPVPPPPDTWPEVAAVIPARDEAAFVGEAVASLAYSGPFSVTVVDDGSGDGTAGLAAQAGARVIAGLPPPPGWAGKVWAMAQGLAAIPATAQWVLFTDADIRHHPAELARMVARGEAWGLDLASLMVRLHCESLPEKALVPAFVHFFRLLYPFRRGNAAAGGFMLVRRAALERIGDLAAIKGALIDDCALAAAIRRSGGRVWLGLAGGTVSMRPYDGWRGLWDTIARTAYTQLGHSPLVLALTVAAMGLAFLAPPFLGPWGWAAWGLMAATYLPMLRFYRRSPLWAPALPLVAAFYLAATVDSARRHYAGRGGRWKGRVQAPARRP